MNSDNTAMNRLQSSVLFFLIVALPALAWGQHKPSAPAPKPSAPAHAPAPAHTSAPAHTAAASRPNTASHTATAGQKPGMTKPGTTSSRTGTTARTSTTGRAGSTGKPGTTAGKSTTPATTGKGGPAAKPGTSGKPGTVSHNASRTPPGKTVALKSGGSASIRPNGKIRSIDKNGMHIEHGMHGGRTVVSEHNGARVVTTGKHGGYVQRPYAVRNGHTYVSRTYVVNGRSYSHVYRSYYYGGRAYYGYYPAYYYNPGFYGWAYNPWAAPVSWGWGWGGAPWYGYYGGYFAPYPVYPTAAFWLTDYLISANLQAAYAAQAEANAAPAGGGDAGGAPAQDGGVDQAAPASNSAPVALSPEVKQAIAEEVKAQLAAEQAASGKAPAAGAQSTGAQPAATTASTGEVPAALDPAHTTFVVASDLAVTADGQECGLTAGDVITRIENTPDSDQKVNVIVTSSKKTDCSSGKTVAVSVDDLQEMHNHFQEQVDEGLKTLASKQGTGGLPKAPDTSTVGGEVPQPPPDTTASSALDQQQAAADQTEAAVVKEAFTQGS